MANKKSVTGTVSEAYSKLNKKILLIVFIIIAYLMICLLSIHVGVQMDIAGEHANFAECLFAGFGSFVSHPFAFERAPTSSSVLTALGISTFAALMIGLWLYVDHQRNAQTMPGKESGSARWSNAKDIKAYNKQYTDPFGDVDNSGNNVIMTQNIFLGMNTRKTQRNLNILVCGGAGSGKSRFFVKPNILQANCNFVVTDPAGELLASTGEFLKEQGYEVKVFNLVEKTKSNCYNPFNYIRDDPGVLSMINCLIKNTNPPGATKGDPFWEKSETALLQALCFYLIHHDPNPEHRNFSYVMSMLRMAEINEQNPNAKSRLDLMFDDVERKDPNSIALKQYKTFKMGAGKTLKSILISVAVRLTAFNLAEIAALTDVDNLDLGSMGEGKKALFVIIPAADTTYNFLVSMMYSQLFETLYFVAETKCEGLRLPRHVRFLLDEFANIGQIPEFTNKLATMRKYEISCSVIIQNLAQLKTMYHDDWETIIGNCDTFLFLGGKEYSTLEYISKELGDQTITVRNNSRSRGKSGSSSLSYNRTGRKLMFPDEIGNMPNNECILMIRGLHPFKDAKYDYLKHPCYPKTGDADPSQIYINTLDNQMDHIRRQAQKRNNTQTPTPTQQPQQYAPTQQPIQPIPQTPISLETYRKLYRQQAGAMAYQASRGGESPISEPVSAADIRRKYGLAKAEDVAQRFAACFAEGLDWLNEPQTAYTDDIKQEDQQPSNTNNQSTPTFPNDTPVTHPSDANSTPPAQKAEPNPQEPTQADAIPNINDIFDNVPPTTDAHKPTLQNATTTKPSPSSASETPHKTDTPNAPPNKKNNADTDDWGFGMPTDGDDSAWNF